MTRVRDEVKEQCRRELWEALGYPPGYMPSSGWEAAIEAVKRQTEQLAKVRGIVR
jgi:hypothetical protein